LNGMNIALKEFDPNVELADDSNLVKVYGQLTSVVTRSDLVRYTVMRNYGGRSVFAVALFDNELLLFNTSTCQ
jgi:hypothetical protein